MTDNEIIKALGCCGEIDRLFCDGCTYKSENDCVVALARDALDLINRQKAEIESKNRQIGELVSFQRFCERKAIKEFAEKLKDRVSCIPQHHFTLAEVQYYIDNLAKEMTEETST